MQSKLTRRSLLKGAMVGAASTVLAACQPKVVEKIVEKEVTKIVEVQQEVTKVVKETVVVEGTPKVIEKVVKVTEAPKDPVTVQFMIKPSVSYEEMIGALMPVFQAKYPHVSVELISADWDEFEPKLMTMIAGGSPPDCIATGGTNPHAERFVRGVTQGLNDFLDRDPGVREVLFDSGVEAYTLRGELISLPATFSWPGTFCNATLFEEAGVELPTNDWTSDDWTWEETLETAKRLSGDTNGDGKQDRYGITLGHGGPWYWTRLWGQDLVSKEDYESGVLTKLQWDDPEVYEACVNGLQARADAMYVHKVTPDPATSSTIRQIGRHLGTGQVAMEFAGSWAFSFEFPEQYTYWAAANFKGGQNGSGTRCNQMWINPYSMTKSSKHKDEAWAWLKFIVTDMEMGKIVMANPLWAYPPMVKTLLPMYLDLKWHNEPQLAMTPEEFDKQIMGAIDQANVSAACHILVGWAQVRDIVNGEMEPVWLNKRTAREAIDAMKDPVAKRIEEFHKQLGL